MSNARYRIPLRVIFYQRDGGWIAHCLEFDLLGDGTTREDAMQSLNSAIATQLAWALENNDLRRLFSPAPDEYYEMFASGEDIPDAELGEAIIVPDNPEVKFDGSLLRTYPSVTDTKHMALAQG